MELQSWAAFVVGTIIVCGTPGPNMLQVMNSSMRHGLRPALFTMGGCLAGVYILFTASMLGVGVFLQEFPAAFDALCYLGAVYLVYLGARAWFNKEVPVPAEEEIITHSRKHIFIDGFLVSISNPKALLFAVAFFPQFINPDKPQAIQFAILLATFAVIEISWYMLYACGGRSLAALMKKAGFRKNFERFTGSLFIMFGIFLIAKPR
jgi:threonine/homoserine/homoserine lactone efflux protein